MIETAPEVDKSELYGKFQAVEDYKQERNKARDEFGLQLARKAVDTPDVTGDDLKLPSENKTIHRSTHPHYAADTPAPQQTPSAPTTASPASQPASLLKTLTLGAALVGAGAGGTAAAINYFAAGDTDTDTRETLHFGD